MSVTDSSTTANLLAAVEEGDRDAVNQLLALHRGYLKRIIDVRLDPCLRGRIDPSDIVQETLVVASRRIKDFLSRRPTSFRIWLRRKALERLIDERRFHRRQKRDVANEVIFNDASSMAIAQGFMGGSASCRAMRHELLNQVRSVMEQLSATDREVLLLRHAEELSNEEAADVLEITPKQPVLVTAEPFCAFRLNCESGECEPIEKTGKSKMNDSVSMVTENAARLGQAANEFFEAVSRGEKPSVIEFAKRFPDIAEHIRRTFPALLLVGDATIGDTGEVVSPHDAADKNLGDFRIVRELGRGGMGTVFEAEQLTMGRHVALKVLPFAALAHEKSLQRFRNEVRAAAALDHPHIVSVYSVGEERGIHYYAMQLIRGQTLADMIEERRKGEGIRANGLGV